MKKKLLSILLSFAMMVMMMPMTTMTAFAYNSSDTMDILRTETDCYDVKESINNIKVNQVSISAVGNTVIVGNEIKSNNTHILTFNIDDNGDYMFTGVANGTATVLFTYSLIDQTTYTEELTLKVTNEIYIVDLEIDMEIGSGNILPGETVGLLGSVIHKTINDANEVNFEILKNEKDNLKLSVENNVAYGLNSQQQQVQYGKIIDDSNGFTPTENAGLWGDQLHWLVKADAVLDGNGNACWGQPKIVLTWTKGGIDKTCRYPVQINVEPEFYTVNLKETNFDNVRLVYVGDTVRKRDVEVIKREYGTQGQDVTSQFDISFEDYEQDYLKINTDGDLDAIWDPNNIVTNSEPTEERYSTSLYVRATKKNNSDIEAGNTFNVQIIHYGFKYEGRYVPARNHFYTMEHTLDNVNLNGNRAETGLTLIPSLNVDIHHEMRYEIILQEKAGAGYEVLPTEAGDSSGNLTLTKGYLYDNTRDISKILKINVWAVDSADPTKTYGYNEIEVKVDGTPDGEAEIIDDNTVEAAITEVGNTGGDVEVEVRPTDDDNIFVEIPKNTMGLITAKTDADLVINAGEASVRLSQETLKSLVEESKGSAIRIELVKQTVLTDAEKRAAGTRGTVIEFNILANGVEVHGFDGGTVAFTVNLPSGLSARNVAAVFVNTKGMFQKAESEVNNNKVTVTSSHCSAFAFTNKIKANLLIKESNAKIKKLVKNISLKKSGKYITVNFTDSEIEALGYNIKYSVYRSNNILLDYKLYDTTVSKKIECKEKGYYKVVANVFDADGNEITKTKLLCCNPVKHGLSITNLIGQIINCIKSI